jgi:hypothetical protein
VPDHSYPRSLWLHSTTRVVFFFFLSFFLLRRVVRVFLRACCFPAFLCFIYFLLFVFFISIKQTGGVGLGARQDEAGREQFVIIIRLLLLVIVIVIVECPEHDTIFGDFAVSDIIGLCVEGSLSPCHDFFVVVVVVVVFIVVGPGRAVRASLLRALPLPVPPGRRLGSRHSRLRPGRPSQDERHRQAQYRSA